VLLCGEVRIRAASVLQLGRKYLSLEGLINE
jgi:hypothetical protein